MVRRNPLPHCRSRAWARSTGEQPHNVLRLEHRQVVRAGLDCSAKGGGRSSAAIVIRVERARQLDLVALEIEPGPVVIVEEAPVDPGGPSIPLQHRTGNGYVFSDAFVSEDCSQETLLANLDGTRTAEPRLLRFVTGRRKRVWIKNCLAIRLSSGFLESLASTSIHLVQVAISSRLAMFPDRDFDAAVTHRFNAEFEGLTESVRDFLIAHY